MSLTQVQPGMLGTPQPYSFKNRLINGNMVLDQRNGGASVTPSATTYSLDRWCAFVGDGGSGIRYSFQQVSTAPVGFSNSLKITTTTSGTSSAGDRYFIYQAIEGFNFADCGWGTANAKTITLSFWVYSSLTGTFGGALGNESQDRSYPFTYTISAANTWTQASVTITGDTTGTWTGATNGTGVKLYLNIATGSTRTGTAGSWSANYYTNATGSVNLGQTASATLYWTGIQIEVGVTATTFDYRAYGQELALAQRYYWKKAGQYPAANTTVGAGMLYSANDARTSLANPVVMRTYPAITFSGSGFGFERATTFLGTIGSPAAANYSPEASLIYSGSGTTTGTAGQGTFWYITDNTSYIAVNAEL